MFCSGRAEDGRSARGPTRTCSTFHVLCSGLLWPLFHQRRQKRNEEIRSSVYVLTFKSHSFGDFTSLEMDAFTKALRHFICHSGLIRQLRSDQGTNFVDAKHELKAVLAELNHERIKAELLQENCDWLTFAMKVPSSSHMGGIWGWQICMVRSVLSLLLQNNGLQLDDESFRMLMCEVETIINSRPLTVDL